MRNRNSLIRWFGTAGFAVLTTLFLNGIVVAQAACGNCQGPCRYGVDGVCTPRTATFGYYQSSWRRWPEPAPPVAHCNVPSRASDASGSGPGLELPEALDEHEIDPEFSHLRKKVGGSQAGVPYFDDGGLPMDDGSSSRSLAPPPSDSGMPELNLDLPAAADEGDSSMNLMRIRTNAFRRNAELQQVAQRHPTRPISRVTYVQTETPNPLRFADPQPITPKAPKPQVKPKQHPRPAGFGYGPNPLR